METKQVIVIRKDLKMRKGKLAAQVAHASEAVFFNQGTFDDKEFRIDLTSFKEHEKACRDWLKNLFTKVVVGVDSEDELLTVYEKAKESQCPCSLIQDAGLTEFDGVKTFTAVAIGPMGSEHFDGITSDLKLV